MCSDTKKNWRALANLTKIQIFLDTKDHLILLMPAIVEMELMRDPKAGHHILKDILLDQDQEVGQTNQV